MEQIFAPWRIEWVEREDGADTGCPFCTLPDRGEDRESRIVARSEHSYVLLNNYPYNPGHAMVIPLPHGGDYAAADPAVLADATRLQQRTIRAMRDALNPDAFNTGMNLGGDAAGGSIDDHLHTHVVPRWDGDTNFMPVISDTSVIVEAIEDTYERLHDAFAALDGASVADSGAVTFA